MRTISIVSVVASLIALVASGRDLSEPVEPDRLPPAQQLSRHGIWQAFFNGCTEGHVDNEYLCACAATYSLDKCEREGSGSDVAIATCIQHGVNAQEAARECSAYGTLVNGGAVPPGLVMSPPTAEPPHLPRATRLQRWTGSFQGCMRAATPAERARAPSIAYTCSCLATYIVSSCAPRDDVTNEHVQRCIDALGAPQLDRVSVACDGYGTIRTR